MNQEIITKFLSGRYFQTVAFTTTYCVVIIGSLILTCLDKIDVKVLLALFSGFTPMVILINEWYFLRNDRKNEKQGS